MIEVRETDEYRRWFEGLRDRATQLRIGLRIRRLALGNLGDVRPVGGGVSELRIAHGPGYRVYFAQRGDASIILLGGGDKSTQGRDINRARQLARRL